MRCQALRADTLYVHKPVGSMKTICFLFEIKNDDASKSTMCIWASLKKKPCSSFAKIDATPWMLKIAAEMLQQNVLAMF